MRGTTIGQYRVVGLIGQGGMGAVYAAEHALLGRPAAIKVLLPELSRKQDIVMRFFNEARAATAIRHPGIVEVYDFGWTPDGAAFIVMEHLQGETLADRAAKARLAWNRAFAIARQIAGALGAAHAKGIVHRDLKPDNIFLVLDPEVPGGERIKLLDFGIAKLAGDTSPMVNVTTTGQVMGTPTYMAPEQCRGVTVDHRADLYALGCIVFELCTGRPPFIGEGTGDVIGAHIHVPPPTLAAMGIAVPPVVERLVQHLLAKPPAQRVPSAEALIHAIDAIAVEQSPASPASSASVRPMTAPPLMTTLSGAATTSQQLQMPRARRGRGIVVVAVMAIAAGAVVATVVRGRSEPASTMVAATPVSSVVEPVVEPRVAMPPPAPVVPVAAPVVPAPDPIIDIDSTPAGAHVVFGTTVLGKTPFHGALPHHTGDATLVVRLDGYLEKRVVIRAGQDAHERIKLVRNPPARPVRPTRDQSVNPFAE